MKKIYQLLLPLLTIYSCSTPPVVKDSNDIVLLFHNTPVDSLFRYDMGAVKYLPNFDDITFALYLDDSLQTVKLNAKENIDTLRIETSRDFLELLYYYQITEDIRFFVKRGDTVDIHFDERRLPILSSRTDEKLDLGYNFISTVDCKRLKYNFLPFTFRDDMFFSMIRKMKDEKRSYYDENSHGQDYISTDTLQSKIHEFNMAYNARMQNDSLLPAQKRYLEYQHRLLNSTKENALDFPISDSLIYYKSYHDFLTGNFLSSYRESKNIPLGANINGTFTRQGGEESNAMLFDSLQIDVVIPPKSKLVLLESCLRIMKTQEYLKLGDYTDKYLAQGGSKHLVDDLLGIIDYDEFNTLKLIDAKGEELFLQDVLDKNIGKVVYLDFWGTNCRPCIQAMPSNNNLRKELNDSDIAFVYIALWDNKDVWNKRQKEIIGEDVNYESYFAMNSKEAKMLKDLKIQQIPHYMIFNSNGQLVSDNAPSSASPNIRKILEKHL